MLNSQKMKELILSILVADSYSLASHWIYDKHQLENLDINWEELNEPKALWHKGKLAGEFTHYGDQTFWLYQFLQKKNEFDEKQYAKFWFDKIQSYNGYLDGATRDTLKNMEEGISPTGSNSTDLSIIGRIVPLLLVSENEEQFLQNVEKFVKITHNSKEVLSASRFFSQLLLELIKGKELINTIENLKEKSNSQIQTYLNTALSSKEEDTFEAIRNFGCACDINGGFQGVIHLLCKYDNLKEMLICNAKAGGDTSARAMLTTSIFMAQENKNLTQIPSSWLNIKATII